MDIRKQMNNNIITDDKENKNELSKMLLLS